MAKPMVSPLNRHVSPVRRRLTLEVLLRALVWCWTGALLLSAAWFVAQPWLLQPTSTDPRWFVVAGALFLATVTAGLLTWRRAPSPLTAALALDERFQLKERTTTLLGLTADQQQSPVGQALLSDVEQRVHGLDIASRFRVRLPLKLWLPPLGATALLILALLFAPVPTPVNASNTKIDSKTTNDPKLVQQGQDELKQALKTVKGKDQPRSEKLQELFRDIDDIANNEFDPNNKDAVEEQVQKLDAQEKKIEDELAKLQEKQEQEQQKLKKELENLFDKQEPKEGPAKKAEEALKKGDLNQAAQELNQLADDLNNGKLNPEERQKLQEQLQELKNRIDQAKEEQKQKEQELEKKKNEAQEEEKKAKDEQDKAGEDSAKAKLEELKKIEGELKERGKAQQNLNKLGQQLGKCEKCLGDGDGKEAAKQLENAAQELKDLGGADSEKQNLENLKQQVENARLKMLAGLDRDGQNGQGGQGGARRPFAKDGDTKNQDARQQANVNEKGGLVKTGFGQGGNNQSKFAAKDLPGAFRLAKQEAAEATNRQGGTLETVEFERHYFENLGKKKK